LTQIGSLFGTAAQFQSPRQPAAVGAAKRITATAGSFTNSAADPGECSAISVISEEYWIKAGRSWHHHVCDSFRRASPMFIDA